MYGRLEQGVAFKKKNFRLHVLCFVYGCMAKYFPDAFALRMRVNGKFRQFIIIYRVIHFAEGTNSDGLPPVKGYKDKASFVDNIFLRMIKIVQIVRFYLPMFCNPLYVK